MQRTKAPFRADEVGSLLRPQRIKEARAKLEKGEITADDLRKAEDRRRIPPLVVALRFSGQARRLRAVPPRDRYSVRGRRDPP